MSKAKRTLAFLLILLAAAATPVALQVETSPWPTGDSERCGRAVSEDISVVCRRKENWDAGCGDCPIAANWHPKQAGDRVYCPMTDQFPPDWVPREGESGSFQCREVAQHIVDVWNSYFPGSPWRVGEFVLARSGRVLDEETGEYVTATQLELF